MARALVSVALLALGVVVSVTGQDGDVSSKVFRWQEPSGGSLADRLNTGFSATPISTKLDLNTESEGSPEFRPSTKPAPEDAGQIETTDGVEYSTKPSAETEPSAEPSGEPESSVESSAEPESQPTKETVAADISRSNDVDSTGEITVGIDKPAVLSVENTEEPETVIEYSPEPVSEPTSDVNIELVESFEPKSAEEPAVEYKVDSSPEVEENKSESSAETESEPAAESEPEPSAEPEPSPEPEPEPTPVVTPSIEQEEKPQVVVAVAAAPAEAGCPVGSSDLTCMNPAVNASLCSGRGDCDCGLCRCHEPHVTGEFCECDSTACPRAGQTALPCGGLGQGVCRCGVCECEEGRTGPSCQEFECPPREGPDRCKPEGAAADEPECSGRGRCVCGECLCAAHGFEKYTGDFCHICPTCPAQCDDYSACVQQRLFSSGVAPALSRFCQSLQLEVVPELGHVPEGEQVCTAPLDDGRCRFQFTLQHDVGAMSVNLRAKQEKICIADAAEIPHDHDHDTSDAETPPHHHGMHQEEHAFGPGAVDEAFFGLKDKLDNIDYSVEYNVDPDVPELGEVSNNIGELQEEAPRDAASTDPGSGCQATRASLALVITTILSRVLF